ncbi:PREDICTED: cell death regulator Aven [Nanorana parkeri]|uniref:cell death regulator Aven n=1 Tax=Nanorana parkeri TaxID=125878 RepID=UPI0008543FA6|nr:PREDICTED: cell death regulator Aven [Nanorana parkeri]
MERDRGRHRRGGGGRRPYRGRGSGGDREYVHRGQRGPVRERTAPPEAEKQDVEDAGETQEVNNEQSTGFSKRKILSNWDRYEATEKKADNEVLQRGTDYNVLLSSAGDSFTQFRFADEKEWGAESGSSTKDSLVYLDSQGLISALQELPLHLRLNVEADLVQEELPQELPQMTLKSGSNMAQAYIVQKSSPTIGAATQESDPLSKDKSSNNPSLPGLDEELDFLLKLEAPVREGMVEFPDQVQEHDQQLSLEEPTTPTLTDDVCLAAEEKHQAVTPEDLEDWLDSMIA